MVRTSPSGVVRCFFFWFFVLCTADEEYVSPENAGNHRARTEERMISFGMMERSIRTQPEFLGRRASNGLGANWHLGRIFLANGAIDFCCCLMCVVRYDCCSALSKQLCKQNAYLRERGPFLHDLLHKVFTARCGVTI